MGALRLVPFDNTGDYLEATKPYDDSAFNLPASRKHRRIPNTVTNPAGPRHEDIIGVPRTVDPSSDATGISAAADLLASHLFTTVDPMLVNKMNGREDASSWRRKAYPGKFCHHSYNVRACYATRSTISPLPSNITDYDISLAAGQDHVESLIPLAVQFSVHVPHRSTPESARIAMGRDVSDGKVWICRIGGTLTAYVLLGRSTPRTIAIRNVYVLPEYRRRGIAEAMVTDVSRYYLCAQPSLTLKGALATGPEGGLKEQICLNVADRAVERLYKRCGFMLRSDYDSSTRVLNPQSLVIVLRSVTRRHDGDDAGDIPAMHEMPEE
ncbi:hypothetical protein BKA93DRAFT_754169 [Sparassis latifolia]